MNKQSKGAALGSIGFLILGAMTLMVGFEEGEWIGLTQNHQGKLLIAAWIAVVVIGVVSGFSKNKG